MNCYAYFSPCVLDQYPRVLPPAATTITIGSTCSKCGTIKKSGKSSCCGRGGSWFRDCGSGGNSKFGHTWSEGIRACKVRVYSKTDIDQRLHASQQLSASTGAGVTPLKAVATADPHADVVVVGITVICLVFLLLLTLAVVVCLFIRKNTTSTCEQNI